MYKIMQKQGKYPLISINNAKYFSS